MLNFHTKDVILIGCIAGACTAGGFVLGSMWEKKRSTDERKAKQMPAEQLTKDLENVLTASELLAWTNFDKGFKDCTDEVQWKNEWMQEGGRIIPDYWKEQKDIKDTNTPVVSKFTDEFGRRGMMCRITQNDGFVIYESFITGGKATYLTILSENHHATHSMPSIELMAIVLEVQKAAAENKVAAEVAAAEVAAAIEKARNSKVMSDDVTDAKTAVDAVSSNPTKQA